LLPRKEPPVPTEKESGWAPELKSLDPIGTQTPTRIIQSVAIHYIDCTIPVQKFTICNKIKYVYYVLKVHMCIFIGDPFDIKVLISDITFVFTKVIEHYAI
jgi:hypothetical protein